MGRARVVTALLALLLLCRAAGGGEPPPPRDPAQGKKILEVKVEGLISIPPETVTRVMATRKGLDFHPATYREDFKRIHDLGHFDAHSIILHPPTVTAEGVHIRVTCRERPVIDRVEFRGNRRGRSGSLRSRARAEKTLLVRGKRYDPFAAHRMARSIKGYYTDVRYPLAEVTFRAEPIPGRPGHVVAIFEVNEGSPIKIAKVVFRGRKGLPFKKLLKGISTRPGRFMRASSKFSEDVLRLDAINLETLYHNNGYSDARVKVLPVEFSPPLGRRGTRLATVTFDVHEGRLYTYGAVIFKGLRSVPEGKARAAVYRALGVKHKRVWFQWGFVPVFLWSKQAVPVEPKGSPAGMPFSQDKVWAATGRVKHLLGETGRPFARVLVKRLRSAKEGAVDLEFNVTEGPQARVGDIRIRGNLRTRDRVIRRELQLLPGDIYDSRKLSESRRRISRRRIFSKVAAYPVPGDEPDTADIELEVEETKTGMMNFGGYVSPEDGSVGGAFSITEQNFDWKRFPRSWDDLVSGGAFRGGAQRLSLQGSISDSIKSIRLDFTNPWIWDTPERYSFGMGLFHTDRDFDYEDRRSGFSVRLGRSLFTHRLRAQIRYRLQNIYIEALDEDLPAEIHDEDEGHTLLSSAELALRYDSRDSLRLTTRGLLLRASGEVFGGFMGGDEDFRRTSLLGRAFVPLFRTAGYPHVLHLYTRANWLNPYDLSDRVPYFERLFGGGINTVRGYDYRTLSPRVAGEEVGGNFLLVESVEYLFPLYRDTLRGVVYFDAGNVWAEEGEFELRDQRRSVGVGLHIQTPPAMGQMPIKLYFSWAINPKDEHDTEVFQLSFNFLF